MEPTQVASCGDFVRHSNYPTDLVRFVENCFDGRAARALFMQNHGSREGGLLVRITVEQSDYPLEHLTLQRNLGRLPDWNPLDAWIGVVEYAEILVYNGYSYKAGVRGFGSLMHCLAANFGASSVWSEWCRHKKECWDKVEWQSPGQKSRRLQHAWLNVEALLSVTDEQLAEHTDREGAALNRAAVEQLMRSRASMRRGCFGG